jgi:hypothetical protein
MRRFDVTLAGLVILDVLGFPVATIPPKGTVDFMESLRLTVAGPAGGTAVDCAKLGLHTALVGVIGTDEAGDVVKGLLGRYGVDPRFLKMTDTVATSSSMVFVSHTGQRPALHARGASDCLTINDLPESSYAAKVFHMGGTGLLRGMDGMPTREALSRAR